MNFSIRQRWVLVTVFGLMLSLALGVSAGLLDSKGVQAQDLPCQFPAGSNPTSEPDLDRDGLSDTIERSPFPLEYLKNQYDQATRVSTKIDNPDTDGDGLCDGEEFHGFKVVTTTLGNDGKPIELTKRTNPREKDTDGDGVSDGMERDEGTDPTDPDDFPESKSNSTPEPTLTPTPEPTSRNSSSSSTQLRTRTPTPAPTATPDLTLDSDGDGLTDGAELGGFTVTINGQERTMVTEPHKRDTDGDNLPDGEEVLGFTIKVAGVDRTVRTDPTKEDSDGDGKTDFDEKLGWVVDSRFGGEKIVTDPSLADTDGDGTPDGKQVLERRNPTEKLLDEDSDEDGLTNGQELEGSTILVAGVERTVITDPTLADTDGDNLSDGDEVEGREITVNGQARRVVSDPTVMDTDGDGLSDLEESVWGTDGARPDTDEDGIPDAEELSGWPLTVTFMGSEPITRMVYSDPNTPDTDGDGRKDGVEKKQSTDPSRGDSDGDGVSDAVELNIDGQLSTPRTTPTLADTDRDGVSDGMEFLLGTNPTKRDTDGDGLTDADEIAGFEIAVTLMGAKEVTRMTVYPSPINADTDGDGLSDAVELKVNDNAPGETTRTNPTLPDSDGDGLSDLEEAEGSTITVNRQEITVKSNPTDYDSDEDTISDGLEVQGYMVMEMVADEERTVKTNPMKQDTDGDGKNDNQERDGWKIRGPDSPTFWTDPTLKDTDGDGKADASPGGSVTDENPVEADEGIAGLFLGPLLASGIPYSAVGLLIVVAGAGAFLFAKLREDTSGDSSQRRLRDQGRELDETRRSLESAGRDNGQLRTEVEDRDRQLRQLESQLQTYQGTAQRREQELGTTASRLAQSANELGEREWVAEIVANLPSAAQPGNGLDDRFTVMTALGRRLDEIRGQATTQRVRARDLISDLRRLGLETDGIARALEGAPATALPSLIGSLEELVRQHTVESMDKDRLLSEIQRAEGLCNREITDAVGRRVPLQFLARARELVEQATSQAEMNAAIVAGDRILDDIYRFYFPRSSR